MIVFRKVHVQGATWRKKVLHIHSNTDMQRHGNSAVVGVMNRTLIGDATGLNSTVRASDGNFRQPASRVAMARINACHLTSHNKCAYYYGDGVDVTNLGDNMVIM